MIAEIQCVLCGIEFFSNPEAFLCKACENDNKFPDALIQLKSNKSIDFPCPNCTFKNQPTAIQCEICHLIFEEKLEKLSPKKQEAKQIVACKKCKFQNHITNEYCLNCEEQLFEHVKRTCNICGLSVKQDNFNKHEQDCKKSLFLLEKEEMERIRKQEEINMRELYKDVEEPYFEYPEGGIPDEPEEKIYPIAIPKPVKPYYKPIKPIKEPYKMPLVEPYKPVVDKPKPGSKPGLFGSLIDMFAKEEGTLSCYYCYQKFQRVDFNKHTDKCEKKEEWKKKMEPKNSRMTGLQVIAIQWMHEKSMKQHESVRRALQQRVNKMGYTNEDLENLTYYIQNYAPIIIQIHISKHMQFFVNDTHYRSQFETNKSSGSLSRASRIQWEDRMFDKRYSRATDYERVKYGVINFTNDPKGVNCAKSYGPSYFLLKSHVRDRCTFTDKDSSSSDASIATLKFPFQIISKMNDQELKAAFNASKALEQSSSVIVTYKEIQIHGPIQFSKDIERVYASRAEINGDKKLLDLVYKFSEMYKVQHDFI